MKRTIALILTLCMLAALLVCPVSAHTAQQQKDADALNHLGLFLGTGKGYELDAELNRNQSVMLLVRMLGKLTEAETGDDSHPFKDVPKWASKVVAYAYTAGLVKGYNATTYGGSDAVSDFQFRKHRIETFLFFLLWSDCKKVHCTANDDYVNQQK